MTLRVPLLPRWLRWLAVAGLAAFIFYASILAAPPETVIDQTKPDLLPLDKWRHFLAYAAFGGGLAYATMDWEVSPTTLAIGIVGITVIYGVGIEFGQSLVPGRYFSLGDAYANAIGGVLVIPWYLLDPYLELVPVSTWLEALTTGD